MSILTLIKMSDVLCKEYHYFKRPMILQMTLKYSNIYFREILIFTLVISVIGYFDYIYEDMTIDVLYLFCLCAVAWILNLAESIICIVEIMVAKVISDYCSHIKIGSTVYDWDAFRLFIMCIVILIITRKVRNMGSPPINDGGSSSDTDQTGHL